MVKKALFKGWMDELNTFVEKKDFKQIELTKIFRQSDKKFVNLLNKIRMNKIYHNDIKAWHYEF